MPNLFYNLVSEVTGELLENEIFYNLNEARDAAFGLAQELELNVEVIENFGNSLRVVEVIEG